MEIKLTFVICCYRFKFKSGNLEHPGDIIRNASVEVLPVMAMAQARKLSGLININFPTFSPIELTACAEFFGVGLFHNGIILLQ